MPYNLKITGKAAKYEEVPFFAFFAFYPHAIFHTDCRGDADRYRYLERT
jgi:hypothetical protein